MNMMKPERVAFRPDVENALLDSDRIAADIGRRTQDTTPSAGTPT